MFYVNLLFNYIWYLIKLHEEMCTMLFLRILSDVSDYNVCVQAHVIKCHTHLWDIQIIYDKNDNHNCFWLGSFNIAEKKPVRISSLRNGPNISISDWAFCCKINYLLLTTDPKEDFLVLEQQENRYDCIENDETIVYFAVSKCD